MALPGNLFAWILPVTAPQLASVQVTCRSFERQLAGRWELVLVPSNEEAWRSVTAWQSSRRDPRLVVISAGKGEPLGASYARGVAAASGSWVGFLEPGSVLSPDALLWLDLYVEDHPQARWFYSDERYRMRDRRCAYFKPHYSGEHILSRPFTGHLAAHRKSDLVQEGLPRATHGAAWHHDLLLRLSESYRPEQVVHLPVALHETRLPQTELEPHLCLTPDHLAAIREALQRRRITAEVAPGTGPLGVPRIRLYPKCAPRVTVVISTRDHADLVLPCIASLTASTRYDAYDVLVIDNQSREPKLLEYLRTEQVAGRLAVHRYDQPFNHSAMHNEVLLPLESDYVVLVNNDVYGFSEGWLEELVATAELDARIAGVGAQLWYPDDTVQHGGVFIGFRGVAVHSHIDWPRGSDGYFGRLSALQELSGSTAALLLLRCRAFQKVGGFDSGEFPTSYNDVDLWLRFRQAGYRCVYNPSVQAYHHESKTRGRSPLEDEFRRRLKARWQQQLLADPFYNPNLSHRDMFVEDWSVRRASELVDRVKHKLQRTSRKAA